MRTCTETLATHGGWQLVREIERLFKRETTEISRCQECAGMCESSAAILATSWKVTELEECWAVDSFHERKAPSDQQAVGHNAMNWYWSCIWEQEDMHTMPVHTTGVRCSLHSISNECRYSYWISKSQLGYSVILNVWREVQTQDGHKHVFTGKGAVPGFLLGAFKETFIELFCVLLFIEIHFTIAQIVEY